MNDESLLVRCKRLSVNITEYFDGMRYLGDLDDASEATPVYLTNLAVAMVMDELADIGITSNFEIEDFVTDTANFEAMFSLREKFDRVNLYEYFKSMTNEQYATLCDILDATTMDEDVLVELVVYIQKLLPLDMHYAQILDCVNHWMSTPRFRKHIQAIQKRIDNTDTFRPVVDDTNVEAIATFLYRMSAKEKALHKCVDYLLRQYKDLSEDILRREINKYDHEKLDLDFLPLFAEHAQHDDSDKNEPSFLKKHHLEVSHHIEYWEHLRDTKKVIHFTKEHAVLIILSLALDKDSHDTVKETLFRLRSIIPTMFYEYMVDMVDNHYNHLWEVVNAII